MKRMLSLVLFCVVAVSPLVAQSGGWGSSSDDEQSSKTAITVGSYMIDKKRVDRRIEQRMRQSRDRLRDGIDEKEKQKQAIENLRERVRDQIINQLINQHVLLHHADKAGITVDEENVQRRLDALTQQQSVQRRLSESGLTETTLKKRIRQGLKIQKFVNRRLGVRVTEKQAREYYNKYKDTLGIEKPFEQIKDNLIAALKQRRQSQQGPGLARELRSETPINVNYPGYTLPDASPNASETGESGSSEADTSRSSSETGSGW